MSPTAKEGLSIKFDIEEMYSNSVPNSVEFALSR